MKVLAGRTKDVDDARTLVAVHRGGLDVAYVRETLAALEEALGQSDLLSVFEGTLRHK